jgi:large subunit ribosomal protein L15e
MGYCGHFVAIGTIALTGRLMNGGQVGGLLLVGVMMVRGLYQHVRETWKQPKKNLPQQYRRDRMAAWRRDNVFTRVERPTRLDAARRMGYKAKQGIVIVRTRVRRGGLRKGKVHMKRKPSKAGIRKITMGKNIQRIAEERVARHYPNMEVLNSYWVGEDGKQKFYEVILVDPSHPSIIADKDLGWVSRAEGRGSHRGRAYRGKTSAGKRGRGLHKKGKGTEKIRPSLAARGNIGK